MTANVRAELSKSQEPGAGRQGTIHWIISWYSSQTETGRRITSGAAGLKTGAHTRCWLHLACHNASTTLNNLYEASMFAIFSCYSQLDTTPSQNKCWMFWDFLVVRYVRYALFVLAFFHVNVSKVCNSCLLLFIDHCVNVYSSADGSLDSFHVVSIISNAIIKMKERLQDG